MPSFLLNKLIRDKVFVSMQELGHKIAYKRLDDQEFISELQRKLLEETTEFDPSKPNAAKELADILEVIETLGEQLGHDRQALRKLQLEIREERGAFSDRIYIEKLDVSDNDPWVDYYRKEPKRFPEL